MNRLPGVSSRRCLTCGYHRQRRTKACRYCGAETKTIEIGDTRDSVVNRDHYGFE